MKNHVNVMNNLLTPNNTSQIVLPPIPQVANHTHQNYTSIGLADQDIATDAQVTAKTMANDNFTSSALNMKNQQVKHLHIEMALQQSHIADQISMLAEQNGWMSHPDATEMEQTSAQSTLKTSTLHMPVYNKASNHLQN